MAAMSDPANPMRAAPRLARPCHGCLVKPCPVGPCLSPLSTSVHVKPHSPWLQRPAAPGRLPAWPCPVYPCVVAPPVSCPLRRITPGRVRTTPGRAQPRQSISCDTRPSLAIPRRLSHTASVLVPHCLVQRRPSLSSDTTAAVPRRVSPPVPCAVVAASPGPSQRCLVPLALRCLPTVPHRADRTRPCPVARALTALSSAVCPCRSLLAPAVRAVTAVPRRTSSSRTWPVQCMSRRNRPRLVPPRLPRHPAPEQTRPYPSSSHLVGPHHGCLVKRGASFLVQSCDVLRYQTAPSDGGHVSSRPGTSMRVEYVPILCSPRLLGRVCSILPAHAGSGLVSPWLPRLVSPRPVSPYYDRRRRAWSLYFNVAAYVVASALLPVATAVAQARQDVLPVLLIGPVLETVCTSTSRPATP